MGLSRNACIACAIGCAVITGSTLASAQSPAQGGQNPARTGPVILSVPWHPTPEEQAVLTQVINLEHEASVALTDGRYDVAEAKARQAISLSPPAGEAMDILPEALMDQGKNKEALEAYQLVADNAQPRVQLPYALLLLKSGRLADAVDAYNKALPLVNWGTLIQANSHFTKATPQKTELEAYIHLARGLTYSRNIDWAGKSLDRNALDEFQQALKLSPDSALVNYELGYGYQNVGDKGQAQAAFSKAIQLGTGDIKKAAMDAYRQSLTMKDRPAGPLTAVDTPAE